MHNFLIQSGLNPTIRKIGKIYYTSCTRANDLIKLKEFLYCDAHLYLIRKKEKFDKIQTQEDLLLSRKNNKTSKYRGICFKKYLNKWVARANNKDGQRVWIGSFDSEEEAFNSRQNFIKNQI